MSNFMGKKKTALFLLFAAILVLAILLYVNNKTAQTSSFIMEGKEKLSVTGAVEAVSNNSSLIYCVKDLLVEAQAENLRVKDIKGNVAWSQKLPGKIMKLDEAGENIITIDSLNNINYYSLQGKLLWNYKAPYEIIDIFTEDNGSFLVEYKGMTGSHAEVFTQNGSKAGNISVENAHVLSYSIGSNAFSISVLDTSAEAIKTKIITYNFKGDILWAQNFDNKIISNLKYSKNNKLLAMGENVVYIFKNDGRLQEETEIEGKVSKAAMGEYLTIIALQDKGKQYSVCYDSNMRELSRVEIKAAPLGLYPMEKNLILYYNDELMVLSVKGELIARFKPNTDINRVYMTSDDKLYIVSNRTLQQLEYNR